MTEQFYCVGRHAKQWGYKPMKILLVDDENIQLAYWSKILSKLGHQRILARSGEQALDIISQTDLDLLVTDAMMPGMDGYQLAEKARLLAPSLPIVMVTGDVNYKINAFEYEINHSILKPASISDIKFAIVAYGRQINCGYMS